MLTHITIILGREPAVVPARMGPQLHQAELTLNQDPFRFVQVKDRSLSGLYRLKTSAFQVCTG
jgi:hypothetical protein